ncbi:hypothetical protein CTI12_AA476160 [Artemisia annua]|uniref:Uncharacterized protein n=1 Tax=Artemisia annua TaxID=35608 RepID=A0A2U1LM97_ARTAN|nr:hypothetical protein CTI12_AA476160 [Artemisia annua]
MSVSLFYLPLAIANTLTAPLNDGIPWIDWKLVLLDFCVYTGAVWNCIQSLLEMADGQLREIKARCIKIFVVVTVGCWLCSRSLGFGSCGYSNKALVLANVVLFGKGFDCFEFGCGFEPWFLIPLAI